MHNKRGHISAYTLMDVLAGMVLMSIVITMVFGVLNSVNKQTMQFQKVRIELNDFMLMQSDINRQVDLCQHIYEIPNGFVLEKEDQELKYQLVNETLLRESDISVDTLHKQVAKIDFEYLEGAVAAQPLITGITIRTRLADQELNAHFYKEYASADPINQLLIHAL